MNDFDRYSRYLRATLGWLEMHYCRSGFFHVGERVLNQYLRILRYRGRKGAIKFCKDSRHAIYCWLAAGGAEGCLSVSQSRNYLPKSLFSLVHLVKGLKDAPIIRLVLTALYASRELKLPVELDTKSITDTASFDKAVLTEMDTYVPLFWKALGFPLSAPRRVPRRVQWRTFHMSTKTSPSGRQSMWYAVPDALSLPDSLVESIGVVGGAELRHKMLMLRSLKMPNTLFNYFTKSSDREPISACRRVAPIQSQEGKTRAVAIMDYWSQTCLRGLHQYLFQWLRKIPQDCTFDQGSFVRKLPENGEPFYSVDLTAATDRFPIDLIENVLLGRFPSRYVKSWRDIMVGYPFRVPDGSFISYATGNPMGAYSSWNSFALSHHFVMFYCCEKLKMNWSESPYVILGDDICIRHRVLAEYYIGVLRSLGIEVSPKKTHISNSFREFAKRILVNDMELTPFPISALWTTRNDPGLTLGVCVNELEKGWVLNERTPDVLSDLYRLLKLPERVVRLRKRSLNIAYDLLIGLQGRIVAAEALKPTLERYYPGIEQETIDFGAILKHVVLSAFAKSASPRKGIALGDSAIQLVCMLTDPDFEEFVSSPGLAKRPWTPIDLIYAIPVLQVHGSVEEQWLEIRKEVFDSLTRGDWKLTLRALVIPMSDQVYMGRNEDIKPKASFSLAKILEKHLDAITLSKVKPDLDPNLLSNLAKCFSFKEVIPPTEDTGNVPHGDLKVAKLEEETIESPPVHWCEMRLNPDTGEYELYRTQSLSLQSRRSP